MKPSEGGYELAPGLRDLRMASIATSGGGDGWGIRLAEENVRAVAEFAGAGKGFSSLLVPNAHSEQGVRESNTALTERARAFGKELAS